MSQIDKHSVMSPLATTNPLHRVVVSCSEKRPLDFDNLIQTTSRSLTLRDHLREQLIFEFNRPNYLYVLVYI